MRRHRTTRVVVWLVVVYLAFLYGSHEWNLFQIRQEKARIQQQIQIYQVKNDLLRAQIKYLSSDEYVEKAAREQLGYIGADEIPYITKPKPANK